MEMRRESRWGGRERPIGKWEGHGLDKGLGEVVAGTTYEYAVVTFSGTPGLVSGPSLKKVDNL
jgi:hypothetical protein